MAINTTSILSNAVRAQYMPDYINAANLVRVYDNLATPISRDKKILQNSTSVVLNFLADLAPVTASISQTADLTPVTMRDATVSISPDSRANAVQDAELLRLQSYTPYGKELFEAIGKNMMESVDLMAQAAALKGDVVSRAAARTSLDAGTASNLLSESNFDDAGDDLLVRKVPGFMDAGRQMWSAIMHPYAYADFRASTNIVAVAQYQLANIILGNEIGEYGSFKLVVNPWAKMFWGAGAANGSAIETTIDANANALAKTISVASATNIDVGDHIMIGTKETGDTHYATNERLQVTSVSGTDIGIVGEGANGGLRFDHASGATVSNDDSVAPTVFGGPMSLAKVYATEIGEYGEIVAKEQGLVNQFQSLGWKFYGDYGRISESWLVRHESAIGRDA